MKKPLLNELTLREKIGQMVHVRPHHIYVDKETGVNYLFIANGYAGGLTPLLDREGKPVITPIINK